MASGHVNRIKRPDTWLHRPMLQTVKKVLANPEPSTHGTNRTCRGGQAMSVDWGRPEVARQIDAFGPERTSDRLDLCQKIAYAAAKKQQGDRILE
jgi:hypothetical protein